MPAPRTACLVALGAVVMLAMPALVGCGGAAASGTAGADQARAIATTQRNGDGTAHETAAAPKGRHGGAKKAERASHGRK